MRDHLPRRGPHLHPLRFGQILRRRLAIHSRQMQTAQMPDDRRGLEASQLARTHPPQFTRALEQQVIQQERRVKRRIAIRANATDRDLGSVVADIKQAIKTKVKMPEGYFVEFGGQFEAQQEATRLIGLLSIVSFAGVFLVLYTLFPSVRIVCQVMLALPIAYVGGVLALWLTGQTLTVASLVGFISLGGIAARNGILLVSHYLHLMREEGEHFSDKMVLRGSLERLAPVLMTALTAGIGLVPLVLGGQQPGKEILYPVATVILGGLITSTACEYIVHPGLFWQLSGSAAKRLASVKTP